MKQPWIHKARTDLLFILSPPFVVLLVVILCQQWLQDLEQKYSFYTWLFFVVFIDVAHVYATLFRTYFVREEFIKRKRLLVLLPVTCFLIGIVLFTLGSKVFWVTLAYVAVFHFIRQQYGFMRLYSRYEAKTKINSAADNLTIYAATVYPMLYWFMSPGRNFTWFMADEFFTYQNMQLLTVITYLYYLILIFYFVKICYTYYKTRYFNIPKNFLVAGTAASWYFGIVYFNNDFIFTVLNIVSHGVPYMALIYLKEIRPVKGAGNRLTKRMKSLQGILFYLVVLLLLALSEEFLWESIVWKEHLDFAGGLNFETWHFLLVPLLVVPQLTHYVLDGIIWKTKKAEH